MSDNPKIPLSLGAPAQHVDVAPGGEIILRGKYTSTHDGSEVDAATTTWPQGAPGGASIDAGGLIDLTAGGFHMTSRDPVTHEVHAVATGEAAPACAALGVAAPCLPLRLRESAQKRLMTSQDWAGSLKGHISVEVVAPPVYAGAVEASKGAMPFLQAGGGLLAAALAGVFLWRAHKKRASSPKAQLLAFARGVLAKARGADPIVAAPLTPALEATLRKLERENLDPTSAEGKRFRVMLEKVEQRLEQANSQVKSQKEQEIVDDLARDLESALEAAEETVAFEARGPRP